MNCISPSIHVVSIENFYTPIHRKMSESEPKVVAVIDEAATKKKYVVMFGYCGTAYHGLQT